MVHNVNVIRNYTIIGVFSPSLFGESVKCGIRNSGIAEKNPTPTLAALRSLIETMIETSLVTVYSHRSCVILRPSLICVIFQPCFIVATAESKT